MNGFHRSLAFVGVFVLCSCSGKLGGLIEPDPESVAPPGVTDERPGGGPSLGSPGPGEAPPPFDDSGRTPPPMPPSNASNPNFLDQEQLFICDPAQTRYTPQRTWRLSGNQFSNNGNRFAGTSQARTPNPFGFTPTSKSFNNYAEFFSIAESQLDGVLRGGRVASARALRDNKISGCVRTAYRTARESGEPADPLGPDGFPPDCQAAVIRYGFERLVSRPPTAEEVDRYQTRMTELVSQLGVERGILASLTMLFTVPQHLFRQEIGVVEPGTDRARLSAWELGQALAYTLANQSAGGSRITNVIEDESIFDPEVRRTTIRNLMDTSGFRQSMEGFLAEYFDHRAGSGIQKDGVPLNTWNRASGQMNSFLRWVIQQDARFLERLLTSTEVFEAFSETPSGNDPQRVGILNRTAWLWSFSQNTENDPIHRGKFIREELFCQAVPAIPVDVVPLLPAPEPGDTLRDRLRVHSESERCWACHQLMDPLGLPFEQFDHFGEFRTEEEGKPVNTTGAIYFVEDIEGDIRNPMEFAQTLAGAQTVQRCFVRHLFRYLMGRDETMGDACTLADAHQTYQDSQGSLRATVESLMMSDTMLYRQVQGE